MRIDDVLQEQFQKNEISRLFEEVTHTEEFYDSVLEEAFEMPGWLDSSVDFIMDIPAVMTGVNMVLVLVGARFVTSILDILLKIARRNTLVRKSPEFREALEFIKKLSNDRKLNKGFKSEREYRQYMKDISKANRLVNKFLKSIVDDQEISLRDKQKALRDVQLLQQKLQAEIRSASKQSKRK